MVQYDLGDETAAKSALEWALAQDGKAAWANTARQRLVVLNFNPREDANRRTELESVLAAKPNDSIALERLAQLEESQGKFAQALELREKVVKLHPQNVQAVLGLVRLHIQLGNQEKALVLAREARRLVPDDMNVALLAGRLALKMKDFAWSLALLREVERKQPKDNSFYYELGEAAYAVGQVEAGIAAWRQALKLDPNGAQAAVTRERLSFLDRGEGISVEAVAAARRLLSSNPQDLPALTALATVSQKSGDFTQAQDLWERALGVSADFFPARRALILLSATDSSRIDALRSLRSPSEKP
jgi:tetratricopeptide (TPR) repeat protein